jgi:hypothetical protein
MVDVSELRKEWNDRSMPEIVEHMTAGGIRVERPDDPPRRPPRDSK